MLVVLVVLAVCLEARFDDLIDLCGDSFFDYGAYIVVFVEHRKMWLSRVKYRICAALV